MREPSTIAWRSSSGFDGSNPSARSSSRDAAGEFGDRRDQVEPQPPGVPEQPGVRQFAHREIELHLVVAEVEPLAEGRHVLRHERRAILVEQGDADIAARYDLPRQLTDDLTELHGEERPADVAHHLAGTGHHRAHLFGRLIGHDARESVGDARGHGLGHLRPHGHGVLGPLRPRHEDGLLREGRDDRRLVEPEGGYVEGLLEGVSLGGGRGDTALRGDGDGLIGGGLPVDTAARCRLHGVLQLADEGLQRGRVVGQSGGSRELAGVDRPVAGQEFAKHLLKFVFGLLGLVV
jgi:hypothetical protein